MDTKVMFSSENMTWATPLDFYEKLDQEFNFNLDVCAFPETAKCTNYYTPIDNALNCNWRGVCFMNPPYGREIIMWVRKAYFESLKGSTIVCLVPARVDTVWWTNYCMRAKEIRFVKGRLKFGDSKNSAPFPSAIVIFDGYNDKYPNIVTY